MTHQERLKALLVERSVQLGDYTLASGAKSHYYIDARSTTMSAEGQMLVGQVGYRAIREAELHPTHVGGLTMGADPITYAIAHRSSIEGDAIDGFSVRNRAKDHGTGQIIEGGLPEDGRVLMIEDTMTTGHSTLQAVEAVRSLGAEIIGILTLINRSATADAFCLQQGLKLISIFAGSELLEEARTRG